MSTPKYKVKGDFAYYIFHPNTLIYGTETFFVVTHHVVSHRVWN